MPENEIPGECVCVCVYVRGRECSGPAGLGRVWGAGEGWWRPTWIERRQSELACLGPFSSQECFGNLLTHTGPAAKIFLCASMSQDCQKTCLRGRKGRHILQGTWRPTSCTPWVRSWPSSKQGPAGRGVSGPDTGASKFHLQEKVLTKKEHMVSYA